MVSKSSCQVEASQGRTDYARTWSRKWWRWWNRKWCNEQNRCSHSGSRESFCSALTASAHGENGTDRPETGSAKGRSVGVKRVRTILRNGWSTASW